jgi:hypothetical protein
MYIGNCRLLSLEVGLTRIKNRQLELDNVFGRGAGVVELAALEML